MKQTEPIGFKIPEAPIHYSTDESFAWVSGYESAIEKAEKMAIVLQRFITVMERDAILLGQNEGAVRHAKEALKEAGL